MIFLTELNIGVITKRLKQIKLATYTVVTRFKKQEFTILR